MGGTGLRVDGRTGGRGWKEGGSAKREAGQVEQTAAARLHLFSEIEVKAGGGAAHTWGMRLARCFFSRFSPLPRLPARRYAQRSRGRAELQDTGGRRQEAGSPLGARVPASELPSSSP